MGTVPVPYTWVDEEIPDFRDMESRLADMQRFLSAPPMIRLRKTNSQSWTSGIPAAISWNFVELETENMWDSTAPTRITPSTPGWYVGTYGGSFGTHATGFRQFEVRKNGSATERTHRMYASTYASGSVIVRGNVFIEQFNGTTDYIEVLQVQNSGTSLTNVFGTIEEQPDIVLRWLATL